MLLSLLGSLFCLLSACRVIESCVLVKFFGKLASCYFSHFYSLHLSLSSNFLVSCSTCFPVLAVASV
jgi:hypothetical protein